MGLAYVGNISLGYVFLNEDGVYYNSSLVVGTMLRYDIPVYVFILGDGYLFQYAFDVLLYE